MTGTTAPVAAYSGSERLFDGVTRLGRDYDGHGNEDLLGQHVAVPGSMAIENGPAETVVLRWPTLQSAADQAGVSRPHGGIHFQDADLRARDMGRRIGRQAYQRATQLWTATGAPG